MPGPDPGIPFLLARRVVGAVLAADEALQAGLVHLGLFAALLLLALAAFPVLFHQLVFLQLAEAGVDLFLGGGDAIDHLLARDDQVGMAFAVGLAVVGEAGARLVVQIGRAHV